MVVPTVSYFVILPYFGIFITLLFQFNNSMAPQCHHNDTASSSFTLSIHFIYWLCGLPIIIPTHLKIHFHHTPSNIMYYSRQSSYHTPVISTSHSLLMRYFIFHPFHVSFHQVASIYLMPTLLNRNTYPNLSSIPIYVLHSILPHCVRLRFMSSPPISLVRFYINVLATSLMMSLTICVTNKHSHSMTMNVMYEYLPR
jgi:hypothetical protein